MHLHALLVASCHRQKYCEPAFIEQLHVTSFSMHPYCGHHVSVLQCTVLNGWKALSPSLWSNAGSYLSIVSISWTGSYLYYNMQAMDSYLPAILHSDSESAFHPLSTVHCSTHTWPLWNGCARKIMSHETALKMYVLIHMQKAHTKQLVNEYLMF